MRNKELSLYIHIPFCVRKCAYCDFLSFPADESVKDSYTARLCRELKEAAKDYEERKVVSIFFGGGTPSVLHADQMMRLMEAVVRNYHINSDAEISIEANPGTVDTEKLRAYKKAGINRLSIGCQSLDDKELKLLGRIHREADFYRAYESARNAGIDNINTDLMSALPGQSADSYITSLKKLIELKPEHISAYSLIIEEGTAFYERYHSDAQIREKGGKPQFLPDEDEERSMLYRGREILKEAAYEQYEISNYALPGYECRHNKVYWQRGNYAGFGIGAASCVDEWRWKNTDDIGEYLSGKKEELKKQLQQLSPEEQRSEAAFLGLRMTRGIDIKEYSLRYGAQPAEYYGEWIDRMISEGLMILSDNKLALSLKGQDLANYVMAGFV